MEPTIEQRVTQLEKQVEEIHRAVAKRPAKIKDWREAVGMIEDTPEAREAFALGEQYRRSQTSPC